MVKRITVVNFIIIDSEDWARGFTASNCHTISDSIVLIAVAETALAECPACSIAARESRTGAEGTEARQPAGFARGSAAPGRDHSCSAGSAAVGGSPGSTARFAADAGLPSSVAGSDAAAGWEPEGSHTDS